MANVEALVDRLAQATEGMGRLEESVRVTRRMVKAVRAALGLAVLAIAAGLIVFIFQTRLDQRQDNRFQAEVEQREVDRCELGNGSRAAIVDSDKAVLDALVAAFRSVPPSTPRTPEQQADFDARLAVFSDSLHAALAERQAPLAPRDCSRDALGLDDGG